jgi:hypothetical protein
MSEPTPFALSHRFSQLIGRKVTFAQVAASLDSKLKQVYGVYTVLPQATPVVVKADMRLLGSVAGALVGWPDQVVNEHLAVIPMEEILRDAIYEVLNVASAAIATEGRAVFKNMQTNPICIDGAAGLVLKNPGHKSYFNVSVDGYVGGKFIILSPIVPK